VENADEGLTLARVWMVSVATGSPVEVWSSAYSRQPLPGPPPIRMDELAEVFSSMRTSGCVGQDAVMTPRLGAQEAVDADDDMADDVKRSLSPRVDGSVQGEVITVTSQEVFTDSSGWLGRNAPWNASQDAGRREALLRSIASTALRGVEYADSSPPTGSEAAAVHEPPDIQQLWADSVAAVGTAARAPADEPSRWCPICGAFTPPPRAGPSQYVPSRHT
jgi:hypothetical protein